MTVHTPIAVQPSSGDPSIATTAQEFRNMTAALAQASCGGVVQQGVSGAGDYLVAQRGAGANLSVDVAAGYAYVIGDDITSQGTYFCWNDATVNVAGLTASGSQILHHRIVLQVQDKLSNGTWSGYQGVLTALLDPGSGLPAEPNSAITLATIDVPISATSVVNANINDYRQRIGAVSVRRNTDLSRSSTTTLTDDPLLQLVNLAANSHYEFTGFINYTGATGNDLMITWRQSTSNTLRYQRNGMNASGGQGDGETWQGSDSVRCGALGASSAASQVLCGELDTGSAPCYMVLQWAQAASGATATTVTNRSWLRLRPLP